MRLKATACVDAAQFLTCYAEDQPACLVTDLRMRGMSGLDLLRYLKEQRYAVPAIIVTGYSDTETAVAAMQAGAITYLEKTGSDQKLCDAISQALELSTKWLEDKKVAERVKQIWMSLNPEERETLQMVAQGKLNKEIAFKTGDSLRTVEDRRRRLMAKTEANSIVDLIRFALRIEENDSVFVKTNIGTIFSS